MPDGSASKRILIASWPSHAGEQLRKAVQECFPRQVDLAHVVIKPAHLRDIEALLKAYGVLLVFIDAAWTSQPLAGRSWFQNRRHTARLTLAAAIHSGIRIIRVLLPGASMPNFPVDLQGLSWKKDVVYFSKATVDEDHEQMEWLFGMIRETVGPPPRRVPAPPQNPGAWQFDVFLSYNRVDEAEVRRIATDLKKAGIRPWFDRDEILPGDDFMDAIETQIKQAPCVAVMVGTGAQGTWQRKEVKLSLLESDKRSCRVIPVILRGCPREHEVPVFLKTTNWVDFRTSYRDALDQLIGAVAREVPTRRKPKAHLP